MVSERGIREEFGASFCTSCHDSHSRVSLIFFSSFSDERCGCTDTALVNPSLHRICPCCALYFVQIRLQGINAVPFEQAAMECCLKHVCKDLLECARNVEPRLRTVGFDAFVLCFVFLFFVCVWCASVVPWRCSTDAHCTATKCSLQFNLLFEVRGAH